MHLKFVSLGGTRTHACRFYNQCINMTLPIGIVDIKSTTTATCVKAEATGRIYALVEYPSAPSCLRWY